MIKTSRDSRSNTAYPGTGSETQTRSQELLRWSEYDEERKNRSLTTSWECKTQTRRVQWEDTDSRKVGVRSSPWRSHSEDSNRYRSIRSRNSLVYHRILLRVIRVVHMLQLDIPLESEQIEPTYEQTVTTRWRRDIQNKRFAWPDRTWSSYHLSMCTCVRARSAS